MRFALALLFATLLAALRMHGAALAQPPPDHELAVSNHARRPIVELYVSPAASDSWGEDRLGDQTLDPGRTTRLKLGHGRDCLFDVQALYEDASREEQHGFDVCRARMLTFDGSAAVAAAPTVAPTHEVVIANRAGRPIQQVLISPADAGDWGDDRLGNASISVGDSATVRYRGGCVADIRVVYDNRSAEERRGADLCVARRVMVQPGWATADSIPTERQQGAETMQLNIVNRSGHSAIGLFLFPAGSADRGPDLLGGTALADGARIGVELLRPAENCAFAAHVVFGGKLPDTDIAGLDLCRSRDVVLPAHA